MTMNRLCRIALPLLVMSIALMLPCVLHAYEYEWWIRLIDGGTSRVYPRLSAPAIGFDGTIYVGSMGLGNYTFFAISKDGKKKWSITLPDSIYASPTVASDGTIYIGCKNGVLYALNPDSDDMQPEKRIKWETSLDSYKIRATTSLGSDGTIYIGSGSGKFYAIDPRDGQVLSSLTLDDTQYLGYGILGAAAIDLHGTIYVVSGNGKLYAINPDGTIKWDKELYTSNAWFHYDEYFASPSIAEDGTIYVAGFDKRLHAFNPDGTEKWSKKANIKASEYWGTAIDEDGTLYYDCFDCGTVALDPETHKQKWKSDRRSAGMIAISANGVINHPAGGVVAYSKDGKYLGEAFCCGTGSSPAIRETVCFILQLSVALLALTGPMVVASPNPPGPCLARMPATPAMQLIDNRG
jgi:outer membrane protein assembly factor BamB